MTEVVQQSSRADVPAPQGMSRTALSVRSWLLVLVVACTLPGAMVGGVYLAHEYQRGREFLVRDSIAMARALTAVVDRELAGTRAALTALAASPYLTSQDLAHFDQQARDVLREQNVNNIVLIDGTHRQVVNTLQPFGSPLQAMHDPLTGLANRTLFDEYLHGQIALCRRAGSSVALLYLDLDDFKSINDRNGHARGDRLLQWVAQRIKQVVRDADMPARLGGDEFAVVLPDTGVRGAELVGNKLLEALSDTPDPACRVRVSIGAAVFPHGADSAEELLHRADQAMYEAKSTAGPKLVMAPTLQGEHP